MSDGKLPCMCMSWKSRCRTCNCSYSNSISPERFNCGNELITEETMNYTFNQKNKTIAFVLIAIGIVSIAASFLTHSHQAWSNLLHNTFYFMTISLAGTFFLAVQYAAEVGWSVVLKRILEAMGAFLALRCSLNAGGILWKLYRCSQWRSLSLSLVARRICMILHLQNTIKLLPVNQPI